VVVRRGLIERARAPPGNRPRLALSRLDEDSGQAKERGARWRSRSARSRSSTRSTSRHQALAGRRPAARPSAGHGAPALLLYRPHRRGHDLTPEGIEAKRANEVAAELSKRLAEVQFRKDGELPVRAVELRGHTTTGIVAYEEPCQRRPLRLRLGGGVPLGRRGASRHVRLCEEPGARLRGPLAGGRCAAPLSAGFHRAHRRRARGPTTRSISPARA
jgi:hypothetical protein